PDTVLLGARHEGALLWNYLTNEEVRSESELITGPQGSFVSVTAAEYSPNGKLVAVATNDNFTRVYNSKTGDLVWTLGGHIDWVSDLAFSDDGLRLISASLDNSLIVWNLETGAQEFTLTGHIDNV